MQQEVRTMQIWMLVLCWALNLTALWVTRRWLGGERQGYIFYSMLVSGMYMTLIVAEWVLQMG